ncbi:MAG: GTPase, partial [Steroidobacteraceae bacterium]
MSVFPQVEFLLSVAAVSQFPPDTGSEIAVAGRSNAGKSSAINAILERRGLA